jgi:hypothetical protein
MRKVKESRDKNAKIESPPKPEIEKALQKMREFSARKEMFVAAIRKSKN